MEFASVPAICLHMPIIRRAMQTLSYSQMLSTFRSSRSLNFNFESLTRDNQSLLLQLQKLKNMLGKPHERNGNNSESKAVKGDPTSEPKEKPCNLSESVNYNINMFISDANCGDAECTEEETGILNMAEPIEGSLSSSEDWCSNFLDQSSGNSQWLEF